MNININFKDKHLIILTSLLLGCIVFSIIELAKATPDLPNPGHSWNQMECDNNLCINTASGRVGIGTTAPGAKLDVAGDARFLSDSMRIDQSWLPNPTFQGVTYTTRASLQFPQSADSSISIHSPGGPRTALVTDGPIMSLESGAYFAGNVGIGTTAPGAKLEVIGDIKAESNNWGSGVEYSIPANDAGAGFEGNCPEGTYLVGIRLLFNTLTIRCRRL